MTTKQKYGLWTLAITTLGGIVVAGIKILPGLLVESPRPTPAPLPTQRQQTGNNSPAIIARDNTTITVNAPPQSATTRTTTSAEELQKLLGDRYTEMRRILDAEEPTIQDKDAFRSLRARIESYLKTLEDALAQQNMVRVHDTTKVLIRLIQSEETKKVFSPVIIEQITGLNSHQRSFKIRK